MIPNCPEPSSDVCPANRYRDSSSFPSHLVISDPSQIPSHPGGRSRIVCPSGSRDSRPQAMPHVRTMRLRSGFAVRASPISPVTRFRESKDTAVSSGRHIGSSAPMSFDSGTEDTTQQKRKQGKRIDKSSSKFSWSFSWGVIFSNFL